MNLFLNLTLLGIITACSNGSSPIDIRDLPANFNHSGVPSIAELANLSRSTSVPNTEITLGSNFRWRSNNTMIAGSVMALLPSATQPSWVIYQVDTATRPLISVAIEAGTTVGEVWCGVADFENDVWDFQINVSDPDLYMLNVTEDNINIWDQIFVVAVAPAGGNASVASVELTVDEPGWLIYTLDDRSGAGWSVDLFVQDGKPMLAFSGHSLGGIIFWRSTTALPESADDWVGMVAANAPNPERVSAPLDTASIDGRPAIVYKEDTEEILRYAYSTVAEPNELADWVSVDVEDCHVVDYQVSLAELEGLPCIQYGADMTYASFARANSATPAADDWTVTVINEWDNGGSWYSMAIAEGKPILSCHGGFTGSSGAHYLRADSASPAGPADWTASMVFGFGTAGGRSRITTRVIGPDDYRPICAYLNNYFSGGLYVSCAEVEEPLTSGDWKSVYIDSDVLTSAICVVDNRPLVIYYTEDEQRIKCAWSVVPEPESFEDYLFSVIKEDVTSASVSCVSIQGNPVIAFSDVEEDCLKFGFYED